MFFAFYIQRTLKSEYFTYLGINTVCTTYFVTGDYKQYFIVMGSLNVGIGGINNMKVITNFKKDSDSFQELIERIFINYYKNILKK